MSLTLTRQAWFVISSSVLVIVCLAVDLFLSTWNPNIVFLLTATRFITDSVVHALIAGWCWFNVWLLRQDEELSTKQNQIVVCAVMGSLLDIDYIIEARLFSSDEADMKPNQRPFLHNTSLILLIAVILYAMVYIVPHFRSIIDFPTMFLVSSLSHHIRDADRKGLWFAPFNSSPPLPLKLYVLLLVLLPLVIVTYRTIPQIIKGEVNLKEVLKFRQRTTDISSA